MSLERWAAYLFFTFWILAFYYLDNVEVSIDLRSIKMLLFDCSFCLRMVLFLSMSYLWLCGCSEEEWDYTAIFSFIIIIWRLHNIKLINHPSHVISNTSLSYILECIEVYRSVICDISNNKLIKTSAARGYIHSF